MLTLDKVYKASHLLKSVARYTDMIESNGLTDDCQLRLKAENLQITGSFKLRGAFFKIANLPQDGREIVAYHAWMFFKPTGESDFIYYDFEANKRLYDKPDEDSYYRFAERVTAPREGVAQNAYLAQKLGGEGYYYSLDSFEPLPPRDRGILPRPRQGQGRSGRRCSR